MELATAITVALPARQLSAPDIVVVGANARIADPFDALCDVVLAARQPLNEMLEVVSQRCVRSEHLMPSAPDVVSCPPR
jgi:hypothetical protein